MTFPLRHPFWLAALALGSLAPLPAQQPAFVPAGAAAAEGGEAVEARPVDPASPRPAVAAPVSERSSGGAATRRTRPAAGQEPYPNAWAPPAALEVALNPARPSEAELEEAAKTGEDETSIGKFLAVGQQSLGVVFYSFQQGRTKGIFAADVVTRLDDLRLEINHLEAQIAGSQPDAPMSWIAVDNGTWYLPLALLYSEEPSELRRPNLRVLGEGCTYHQNTGAIEVHGRTHTWIHPTQNLSDSTPGTDALAPRPHP